MTTTKLRYAIDRLRGLLRPPITVRPAPEAEIVPKERATWTWRVPHDLELCGPMTLRLRVSLEGADVANLFAGVEKWRDGRFVPFEGSYGFGLDRVTTGWRKLSRPEVGEVEVELGPSATFFRAGEEVRLILAGRWPTARNLITGQFLAAYEPSPDCAIRVHCGGAQAPRLSVPVVDS